jgi:salicylate hydroxylase
MKRKPHVLIAGAGLGGLTAALALLKQGIDVDVLERANVLGEIGAGISITPNGARVLLDLGLSAQLDEWADRSTRRRLYLWSTGQHWDLPDHGNGAEEKYGAPYLFVHRADLHRILVDAVRALKPDAIHVKSRAAGVEQGGGRVTLRLADGRRVEGDCLVGADGVRSAVRAALFGEVAPRYTGQIRWRGTAPIEAMPDIGASLASWIGPGSFVTMYPVRCGTLINFVGSKTVDWPHDTAVMDGTTEELARDYAGWHESIQRIVHAIDKPIKWALFRNELLERWSVGRVTLLGDACHATLPSLGQGANMAIEDAGVLGRALGAHDDVETALAVYERKRLARTARIVTQSNEMVERRADPALNTAAEAEAYVARLWSRQQVADLYDWIYAYDAMSVDLAA